MGAMTFIDDTTGETPEAAFQQLVNDVAWECGHGGYTGTIAEKTEFVVIGEAADLNEACNKAQDLIDAGDPRIDDKWGPAGCIRVTGANQYVFFGWASS